MLTNRRTLVLGLTVAAALGACTSIDNKPAQFWQRSHVSDAIYQQGPKAQQTLNRDISQCVVEMRELERLGSVKDAIPVDNQGRTLNPSQQALYDWETPDRDKHLLSELKDYSDFESCMMFKGWERVEHVPFDVSQKGRDNYLRHHVDKDYIPRNPAEHNMYQSDNDDYSDVNE